MTRPRRASLGRDEGGASAIEFALFAPFLIFGLLMMAEAGLRVFVWIDLNRAVRAGTQAAITLNNDPASIRAVALASSADPEGLQVEVDQLCSCGAQAASCTAICAGGAAPSVFFDVSAQRAHAGLISGEAQIAYGARVKIR